MPSCIIFTQALRAGSSNCVLDGSLDGDVSFTNFMNEYHVLNVAQCVINSSNACGYPSCLLSLHVNTFHDRMDDQRTSYGAKGKRSSEQGICI